MKGFRVLDTSTKKVEVVRDLKFLLNEFSSEKPDDSGEDENSVPIQSGDSDSVEEVLQPQQQQQQQVAQGESSRASEPVAQKIVQRRNTKLAGMKETNILDNRLRDRSNSMLSVLMMAHCEEPTTYEEAVNSSDKNEWIDAMQEEYDSLLTNKTWILVDAPENQKVIDNKWVYKVKRNPDTSIERDEVGRGFRQEYGIDYEETFSPVVRFSSIRTLLAIAAQQQFKVKQFDIKTAFLYESRGGCLHETTSRI